MEEKKPIYKNNVRINSPQGVNRLLQRVINALIQGDIEESKAKTIGYLCNIVLKGLEAGELQERIEDLERQVVKDDD
jgi:hypothetical protein